MTYGLSAISVVGEAVAAMSVVVSAILGENAVCETMERTMNLLPM